MSSEPPGKVLLPRRCKWLPPCRGAARRGGAFSRAGPSAGPLRLQAEGSQGAGLTVKVGQDGPGFGKRGASLRGHGCGQRGPALGVEWAGRGRGWAGKGGHGLDTNRGAAKGGKPWALQARHCPRAPQDNSPAPPPLAAGGGLDRLQKAGSVPHTPGAAGQFRTQTPSIPLAAAGSELGTQEGPTRGGGRAGAGALAGAAL